MNRTAARFAKFGAGLLGLVMLGWILTGQAKPGEQELPYHEGVPTDWSNSHVMFSKPASDEQARQLGEDPRYWQQLYRRELTRALVSASSEVSERSGRTFRSAAMRGLWSEDMGKLVAPGPGAGTYPAKYSFNLTTANCAGVTGVSPDYVVYTTGLEGSGTQASVVAFDNLYSGCGGTVPSVYWAYNTGGLILTSPVISLDGTQVAFVQTSSSLTAALVLLKWKASATETIALPGVPTSVTASAYQTCVAPCMTEIFLHDGSGVDFDDRTSSLYYDYTNDIGWVGGATGWLVKLTGLFKGTPTEVSSGGFPVHVYPTDPTALYSPVYDRISKNVFVGDAGGYFHRVSSTTGAVTNSAELDFGTGLVESPLLDQTNGFLYVFASSDGTTNCAAGTTACAAVYVLGTSFASGSTGTEATVGQSVAVGNTPNPLYLGGLDSGYYNSVGGTGNLYVCGNTGSYPLLYRVPITSGSLGTAVEVVELTPVADKPSCSPVTDFPNPNASASQAELIFFSVQSNGHSCGGLKGCLINFVSLPWQPKTAYTLGQEILVLNANGSLYIEASASTATSGATQPAWSAIVGEKVTDGGVTWVNQGKTTTTYTALGGWKAATNYPLQSVINDGANVEVVVVAGKSGPGPAPPTWSTTVGGNTIDNKVTWVNAGPWPTASLTVTGGTGGLIVDGTSTSPGASQVYFFTLGNETCTTTTGNGICAMQASQSSFQ